MENKFTEERILNFLRDIEIPCQCGQCECGNVFGNKIGLSTELELNNIVLAEVDGKDSYVINCGECLTYCY